MTVQTNTSKFQKGFTLIELLVVIGILAVLLALVLIAINPAKQFEQANNTKRSSDVNAILNAIHQYAINNSGNLPPGITTSVQNISNSGAPICGYLVTRYIAALPADPQSTASGGQVSDCGGTYDTDYTVVSSASDSRITVAAPRALPNTVITVTR